MPERDRYAAQHGDLKKWTAPRTMPFLFLLAGGSVACGYLLSKINLVGRTGIALFYNQYRIFRYWWKSALAVFAIWLFLFWLQGFLQKKLVRRQATLLHLAALAIAAIGLAFTYTDFRTDVSHRLVGERFHLGFYLFWVGWMGISLFYLFAQRPRAVA